MDPGNAPAGAADVAVTPPVAAPEQPSRRTAILRTGLVVGVLVLVFGVILPRFIDYGEVVAAFRALTLAQLALMTVAVLVAWLVCGWMLAILVPGMSVARGTQAYLILAGIGASVPMGPWNMAVVWVVMRGWGVGIKEATSGIAVYGVLNTLTRLVTPLLAFVALLLTGGLGGGGIAAIISLMSTVALVIASAFLVAIVRSERTADRVAATIQTIVDWGYRSLGRADTPQVTGGIRDFRDLLGELIRRRGLAAMAVGAIGQLVWTAVLVVALRVVGVGEDALSYAEVLAVFALTSVITIIPIAPGGAGIPELLYIAGLTAIAGAEWEGLITAGVMLFRLFQWFMPIPIAWILLKVARGSRSLLPTPSELRTYAVETA
jgi:putative heme transporter